MASVTRRAFTTVVLTMLAGGTLAERDRIRTSEAGMSKIELPPPSTAGDMPLTEAIGARRSVRDFRAATLRLEHVSQLLWATQGVTSREGFRTPPSAGALYPLELRLAAGRVDGLAEGIYHYEPASHRLVVGASGDKRRELAAAAFGQRWIADSAAVLIISAVYKRTTRKYGRRGIRYVHIEAGHAAQNALLAATAQGIGATPVGAFDDATVAEIAGLSGEEQPLYLIPLGRG
jgi:SagB-type dehydrogenase family enzyme